MVLGNKLFRLEEQRLYRLNSLVCKSSPKITGLKKYTVRRLQVKVKRTQSETYLI